MLRVRKKVVPIGRVSAAQRLLDEGDVDDMLDAFAIQDAEVVRVDVNIPERPPPRSGLMRKVEVPNRAVATDDADIEELTDGVTEGWEDA